MNMDDTPARFILDKSRFPELYVYFSELTWEDLETLNFEELYDVAPNVDRIRFRVLLTALRRELDHALMRARTAQAWQISPNGVLDLSRVVSGSLVPGPMEVPLANVLTQLQSRSISLDSIHTLCLSACNISNTSLPNSVSLFAQLPNIEVVDLSRNELSLPSLDRADPTIVKLLDQIATATKNYLILRDNNVQGYLPHAYTCSHGPKIIWFEPSTVETEDKFNWRFELYCPKLQPTTSIEIRRSHVQFYQSSCFADSALRGAVSKT